MSDSHLEQLRRPNNYLFILGIFSILFGVGAQEPCFFLGSFSLSCFLFLFVCSVSHFGKLAILIDMKPLD